MTTGASPYVTPPTVDRLPGTPDHEIEIHASYQTVDIGGGVMANAEVYNGTIPGPTLRFNVNDTVIVRLVNDLDYPTGIHWHGIELHNGHDGTPVTQNGAPVGPFGPKPVMASPTGGTYLYRFKVTRPGIFWYHPHHHYSTNRVFKGLYGMFIVTDPDESTLVRSVASPANTLPAEGDTLQLVLSDMTVCSAAPNDLKTYDFASLLAVDKPEWLSPEGEQPAPMPMDLCQTFPLNEDGTAGAAIAAPVAGTIPNIQKLVQGGQPTNEGQTVLTNGVNVGARFGTPGDPKSTLETGAEVYNVDSGQGLRLQIVNCATVRYFRLFLTTGDGDPVNLIRIGGEGGLLDNAVLEGGTSVGMNGFNFHYNTGEILLPPASRVDVVAVIPTGLPVGHKLTLWTRDFERTGGGPAMPPPSKYAKLPTVPVMHLNVTGSVTLFPLIGAVAATPGNPAIAGTPLRAKVGFPGSVVEPLKDLALSGSFLDPGTFPAPPAPLPPATPGMSNQEIALNNVRIDSVVGDFAATTYTLAPHIASSRYAQEGDHLELKIRNATGAHHPFHLHGFSFQPLSLVPNGVAPGAANTYTWPYQEWRDNLDIPRQHTLTFRVRLDARNLADDTTPGGAMGRWLFHCHIFFHAHQGMISELVVTAANGRERPYVDVGGSWAYAALNIPAKRTGTFSHLDGDLMTLTATLANGTAIGTVTPNTVPTAGGNWTWTHTSATALQEYVYITATDTLDTGVANPAGRKGQAVFWLKIGSPDEGSDIGDPHIYTVDGKRYDMQAVGEFTLLRDREQMVIQTRQSPVETANPYLDPHTGLKVCVSVNTAVAAQVGSHRIAYQPTSGEQENRLQFFLDGKPADLSTDGIDLGSHRVSAFDANGQRALRVDYENQTVLTVTPRLWTSHNIWIMDIRVAHTQGEEGLMGPIPQGSWLPKLPSGSSVGPKPAALSDRYDVVYKTFANAWRVTDQTSMFVYAPGTSTATFTDLDWPSDTAPCKMKPEFGDPVVPTPQEMPVEEAEQICKLVTEGDLHADCVFDVAATGDKSFAEGYLLAQELRLRGSAVHIGRSKEENQSGDTLEVTATVTPMRDGRPMPTGSVTFLVDGVSAGPPVKLDEKGRARLVLDRLDVGSHKIRAAYTPDEGEDSYHSSSSPNLLHTMEKDPGSTGGWSFGSWWIWICIILVLIAIAAYAVIVY